MSDLNPTRPNKRDSCGGSHTGQNGCRRVFQQAAEPSIAEETDCGRDWANISWDRQSAQGGKV